MHFYAPAGRASILSLLQILRMKQLLLCGNLLIILFRFSLTTCPVGNTFITAKAWLSDIRKQLLM